MVYRFPPNLNRNDISVIEAKPSNMVFELATEEGPIHRGNRYKSRKLVNNSSLVGAQFQSDGLHLVPIHSSHEFKHSLDHLNIASKQKSISENSNPVEPSETVKVAAVTMRFAAVDEEEKRRIREGTFNHYREVLGREKTIELNYQTLPDNEGDAGVKTEPMET